MTSSDVCTYLFASLLLCISFKYICKFGVFRPVCVCMYNILGLVFVYCLVCTIFVRFAVCMLACMYNILGLVFV